VIHDELRAVRSELQAALAARDLDKLLSVVHPNVVFTTTSGQALRGHEGIRAYYTEMLDGPGAIVESFAYDVQSDNELSILYGGDVAIAWGPSKDHYELRSGQTLDMTTRWMATLVKEDGRWLIASGQTGLPAFDNPLLAAATGMVPKAALGGALGGLLLGGLLGFLGGRLGRR
jgi:uncharacterized protein (TIGR02246 family)